MINRDGLNCFKCETKKYVHLNNMFKGYSCFYNEIKGQRLTKRTACTDDKNCHVFVKYKIYKNKNGITVSFYLTILYV